jgi:hypothetical protein
VQQRVVEQYVAADPEKELLGFCSLFVSKSVRKSSLWPRPPIPLRYIQAEEKLAAAHWDILYIYSLENSTAA